MAGITPNSIPIPDNFKCPLSLEVFVDPVVAADGQTYERGCIEEYFRHLRSGEQPRSPLTRQPIMNILTPNICLRNAIEAYFNDEQLKSSRARLAERDLATAIAEFERERTEKSGDLERRVQSLESEIRGLEAEKRGLEAERRRLESENRGLDAENRRLGSESVAKDAALRGLGKTLLGRCVLQHPGRFLFKNRAPRQLAESRVAP
mmetsp:Transcript_88611/g.251188  ORF Transcript_88611/g.251188 Transcript_88611/m.251188 type:complete len:206 (-) Transcript_88611:118-735(-)